MSIFGGRQPGQPRYSGQLHNMSITESVFGTTLPILIGTTRVHGKLLDYNGFLATQSSAGGGKGIFGGGKDGTITEYSANVAIALAQGPCAALLSVWDQQGKLANQTSTASYTVPTGGGTFSLGRSAVNQGVTTEVSYTVTANDYGSGGPVTYTGTQLVALEPVSGTPGANQYNFNPATGTYTFPAVMAGTVLHITTSSQFSLYYFEVTQAVEIPPYPYSVSTDNQPYFQSDGGVTFVDTGEALTGVGSSSPGPGEYWENVGAYTFNAADAGRYVYIKYTYYSSDASLTSSSALNLTFFNGAQGQSPWGFFVSHYPASAFGYTGICYVGAAPLAMGESPTLPSYNYEVAGLCIAPGQQDADVTQAITLLLTAPLCGVNFPGALADWSNAKAYWFANNFFISDSLTSQEAVGETIKKWLEAGNVAAVNSVEGLKLIPYGDKTCVGNGYTFTPQTTPVAYLTQDDLLPFSEGKTGKSNTEDPIQVERAAGRDAYNYMQAEWTNRENDYNNELTPEQNDAFIRAYGLRMECSQSWHFLTTQAAASWALNLRMKRGLYKRNTYKINLGWNFSHLEEMDIIVLPTGEPIRITEIDDDENGKRAITAEQFTYGSGSATIYPKQPPVSYQPNTSQALPGSTSAVVFESSPQSVLAQPNTIQIAVAGSSPNWGGCDVYVSTDGTSYAKLDRIRSGNRTGLLSAALPATADPDTADTLSVDMTQSNGELVSATLAEADSFVTLAAIIDAAGTMELVSYETATLTGANRYGLSYLRRGVYGTTIGAHSIGAEFAYLGSTGIFNYQYPAQYVGKTIYFKFPAFNLVQGQQQGLPACEAYPFTIPGTTLQPPSSGTFTTVPANPLGAYTVDSTHAYITCEPFTGSLNNLSASELPAGTWTSAAVAPGQTFYVYFIDYAFAGGAITPIVTQDSSDFLGKVGYYLIGTVATPAAGTAIYSPTASVDTGDTTTNSPANAYDGNSTTFATVTASDSIDSGGDEGSFEGICTWYAFSNISPTGETLYVDASVAASHSGGGGGTASITALAEVSWDGGTTWSTLFNVTTATLRATYTAAVPSGTDLDEVQVRVTVTAAATMGSGPISTATARVLVYEIQIH